MRQLDTDERWLIAYTWINLDGADVRIREQTPHGLSPQSVDVGDTVGFLDRDQQQRSGKIIRLNEKSVTLLSNGQKWRVGYGLLHHVVDSSAGVAGEHGQFSLLE